MQNTDYTYPAYRRDFELWDYLIFWGQAKKSSDSS